MLGVKKHLLNIFISRRRWPSYFDKLPPKINKGGSPIEPACACDVTTGKGKTTKCVKDGIPAFFPSTQKDKFNRIKMCDRSPEKRDLKWSDDLTDEDYELFMKPLDPEAHKRQKRSVNVISKENVTRYCAERLAETPVGKMCAKLGTNVQALVNVCASDLEYTGDRSFAIGAVAMLMDECDDVIIETTTVNSNDSRNFTAPKMPKLPPIVEEIAQLLCPNDCNFRGKCVNGSCVCNKDYTAEDCSVSVFQKPFIARLQSNGLCDRRKRPCKKVAVQGNGFLNSTNVTCHIKEIEVVNSSWIPNKNETKHQGMMTDLVLVECFLPDSPVLRTTYDENVEGTPASGLLISVSNNGIHQSEQELKLISFDSVCMECNISTGCSLKNNSCFINRYCFSPNEPNPKDWCEQCLPDVDKNKWSERQVNHLPSVTSTTDYYVVHGESLELPIEVTDPEGMPVTVSIMDGSPAEALVQNNILFWNVTTNKTTQFFFKATDACQASATLNISVTVNVCPCNNNGRCIPRTPRGRGFYDCSCSPGFTGQYCSTEIDECESYPCLRGQCIDQVNNYTCVCDLGFEGRNCDVDIDYCQSSPCVHGNCTDQVNGYTCSCVAGYSGLRCDVDIDECSSSPCVNNGSCVDKINAFDCTCLAGFSGSLCEENINECLLVSCGNGTCFDQVNNYSCVCNVGYSGGHCDVPITRCSNETCYPGVRCFENTTHVSCGSCPSGFTGNGKNCKDIDDCVNHTCANGGSCVDGINNYTCSCLAGFTGILCNIGTLDLGKLVDAV
ncbi:von Willebrand factor D and EGF domain-containing protein-like isoform X2 [Orbicella faveolata]|uniref:von Willebrand factor D and EGF domain-containing protein-like isoform X2 n=1 Tax=Orbicella faveolata TaxID=48498 RepID=UPI0009E5D793|nr:von Willebrand factor D and EGF domain-containing protein-like isoform X2 [Orbicella faveolata]